MQGQVRFAVDLGTSNTVAVVDRGDGTPRPLLFDGNPLLPSAVFADASGTVFVGRDAERHMATDAARYEPNPKGHVDEGLILLGDREVPVVELLAAILRRVAGEAAQTGVLAGGTTVLTCPADWGPRRRAVLSSAADVAGLGRVTLLDEPVAAATYCMRVLGARVAPGRAVAVFDFGGGTLDVTVAAAAAPGSPDALRVLATGGLDDLGGTDIDAALVGHLGQQIAAHDPDLWRRLQQPRTGADFRDRMAFWSEVRAAKEMLSRAASAPVHVPGVDQATHLTREELDRVAGPLVDRAVDETRRVLQRSGVPASQLDAILLVGGSSRLPLVASRLHARFGMAPIVPEQPELPVAFGALLLGNTVTLGAPAAYPSAPPPTDPPPGYPLSSPPGYTTSTPAAGYPASTPSSGYPASGPPTGYQTSAPPAGYAASAPSSGYPASAYPASSPSPGYPASAPPSDYAASTPSSGYAASTPSSDYAASTPSSGYPASAPPSDYAASSPSSGYAASAPPAGYAGSTPSSGYPASGPPTGYQTSASPAGYPASSPSSGFPASSPSSGYPASSPPAGYQTSTPPAGYPASGTSGAHPGAGQPAGYPPSASFPASAPPATYQTSGPGAYASPAPAYPPAHGAPPQTPAALQAPVVQQAPVVPQQQRPQRPSVIIGPGVTMQGNVAIYGDEDLMPQYAREDPPERPADPPPAPPPARPRRSGSGFSISRFFWRLRLMAVPLIIVLALTPWGRGLLSAGRDKIEQWTGNPQASAPASTTPTKAAASAAPSTTAAAPGPTAKLTPGSVKVGTASVKVTGTGFDKGEQVTIKVNGTQKTVKTATSTGTVEWTMPTAALTEGKTTVELTGSRSKRPTKATLEITA
ncbi:Hsp70 family protein [Dactylosporangium sp. NPDC006015]|uniref:Hsp70 family protein n=1 Tax=Dactylosporangium sp. NPDC006015 TaxID=3154576 RepID=UPI0033AD7BEF